MQKRSFRNIYFIPLFQLICCSFTNDAYLFLSIIAFSSKNCLTRYNIEIISSLPLTSFVSSTLEAFIVPFVSAKFCRSIPCYCSKSKPFPRNQKEQRITNDLFNVILIIPFLNVISYDTKITCFIFEHD